MFIVIVLPKFIHIHPSARSPCSDMDQFIVSFAPSKFNHRDVKRVASLLEHQDFFFRLSPFCDFSQQYGVFQIPSKLVSKQNLSQIPGSKLMKLANQALLNASLKSLPNEYEFFVKLNSGQEIPILLLSLNHFMISYENYQQGPTTAFQN
jgi:hypothetical protein